MKKNGSEFSSTDKFDRINKNHKFMHIFVSIVLFCLLPAICFCEDMVEVSVEVTEINNDKASELGIKWVDDIQTGEISQSDPAGLRTPASLPDVPSLIKVGDWKRYSALTAELHLLQSRGAAQILSKPKLVTKSGTSAKFLVGGEFPVIASGVSGGTIEWKEYGIKTEILPTILADKSIDLVLTTEVSRLDMSNAVQGYPAILKRTATSHVRVKNGQTIALAGMIETTKEDQVVGIPILMDIPLLGYLFSKKDRTETKTTALIFVTPRIVE